MGVPFVWHKVCGALSSLLDGFNEYFDDWDVSYLCSYVQTFRPDLLL